MANDIDKTSPHYKGDFGSIYEVNQKFPSGGVEGDYVAINGWAHYWNADRGTWCVNAQRDSYWDELITNIIEHFKTIKGSTYMGVATTDTVPDSSVAKMFYFALQGGKYANFGNQDVAQGINVLLTEDGKSWTVQSLISVAQELGASTTMLVSQKAITDALNRKANTTDVDEALGKKASKEEFDKAIKVQAEIDKVQDSEISKKFDKANIAKEFGDAEDKVVSQFALPFRKIESPEFLHCIVDAEDHFLFGIQLDGSVEWSVGIPAPIRKKLQEIINQSQQDKTDVLEALNTAKEELSASIAALQEGKVDKEEGKSLIDDEVKKCFKVIENEDFIHAITDAEDRVLFGIKRDTGKPYFPLNDMYHVEQNEEFFAVWLDAADHVLFGIKRDGQVIGEIHAVNVLREITSKLQEKVGTIDASLSEFRSVFSLQDNPEYLAVEEDAEGKVLSATHPDGSHYIHKVKSETIPTEFKHIENGEYPYSILDDEEKMLGYLDVNGVWNFPYLKSKSLDHITSLIDSLSQQVNKTDVFSRNEKNIPILQSACRYNNGDKDFQMCIITDSHAEELAVRNAVTLTNKINVIDAIIHCGDIVNSYFNKNEIASFFKDYTLCTKPWLVVIGNHDVGNTMYLQYSATHDEIYQYYIKPMIDGGILKNGECQEDKAYYFHDFADRKIRVIVPYEYDNPLDVADNDYWDSIDYDESLPQLVAGNTYHVGDKVNSGGYKGNSFLCKKEVVTINNQYDDSYTIPYYKAGRCARVIRKEQAEWLVNTLNSTPNGYGVIIATHNPAMLNSTNQIDSNFAVDTAWGGTGQGQYAMDTDLISEIVNAFIQKTKLSIKVVMKSANWYKADASYMNVLGDTGDKYAYQVDADFTSIQDCYFACYVGGHAHKDLVFKHNSFNGQFGINPICATTYSASRSQADIVNVPTDCINYDALTCISVSKGRIALSRLGNQLSVNGKHRDFEIINF